VTVREDAVDELPTHLAELFLTFGIPEEVFSLLAHRYVSVHAVAVDADDRLRQKAGGEAHVRRDLAADQLGELGLVGGGDVFAIPIVYLKLGGCLFGVVLLILKAHGALPLGGGVDERAQRVAR